VILAAKKMSDPGTSFQMSTPTVSEFSGPFFQGGNNGFFTSRFMLGGQNSQENFQNRNNSGQFESRLNNSSTLNNFFASSESQSLMLHSSSSVTSIESSSLSSISSISSDIIPDEFRQAPSLQFGEQLQNNSRSSKRKLSQEIGDTIETDVDKLVEELLEDSDSNEEPSEHVNKKIKGEVGESKKIANREHIEDAKPQIGIRKDLFMQNAPSLHPQLNANVTVSTPSKTNTHNTTTISVSSSLSLPQAPQEIKERNISNNDPRILNPNINPFGSSQHALNSLQFLRNCDTLRYMNQGVDSLSYPNPLQNSATLLNVIKRINEASSEQRRVASQFPYTTTQYPHNQHPHIVSRMYEQMIGGNTHNQPQHQNPLGQSLSNRLHGNIDLSNLEPTNTRPRYKKKTDGVPLFDDPTLPPGWRRSVVMRKTGSTAGGWDTYIHSPPAYGSKKFRSKQDIRRYFEQTGETTLRWEDFDFNPFGSKGQHEMLAQMKSSQGDQTDSKVVKGEPMGKSEIAQSYNPEPTITKASNLQEHPNIWSETETKFDINSFLQCEIKEENIM